MARPKVDDNARQRTAQACESCKRRKQKCNGLCPCNTCEKRKFQCIYTDRDHPPSPTSERKTKRRLTEASPKESQMSISVDGRHDSIGSAAVVSSPRSGNPISTRYDPVHSISHDEPSTSRSTRRSPTSDNSAERAARSLQQFSATTAPSIGAAAREHRAPSASVVDEEALIHTESRMLEDIGGRFLYVGDSGTLSFVQLLRVITETITGPSPFTTDPTRHKMMETQLSLPLTTPLTHVLPGRKAADVLIESFFSNTCGLVEICKKSRFIDQVNEVYDDPLRAERHLLCVVNLVFAIGLQLANPQPNTEDARIIDKLRSDGGDRAELFYLNARSLNDPLTDFGDSDFGNIQALLLMGIYMLTKTKRNAAFALVGMAIRSAYGLGLHREEAISMFSPEERAARKSVWRSLFVIDKFLSSSLGRPSAISEEDCSGDALFADQTSQKTAYNNRPRGLEDGWQPGPGSINKVVSSCSAIGNILRHLYRRRVISTRVARDIGDLCRDWPRILNPQIPWKHPPSNDPDQDISRLYANLFHCHAVTLLARPFFLYMFHYKVARGMMPKRGFSQTEKYSEACVVSGMYTINLLKTAYENKIFARRNPFFIYFLFAAAVVVIANEFAELHNNTAADSCTKDAVIMLTFCAEADSQAGRVLYMLTTFRDVVQKQRQRRQRSCMAPHQLQPVNILPKGMHLPAEIRNIPSIISVTPREPPTQLPAIGHFTVPIPMHQFSAHSNAGAERTPSSIDIPDARRASTSLSAFSMSPLTSQAQHHIGPSPNGPGSACLPHPISPPPPLGSISVNQTRSHFMPDSLKSPSLLSPYPASSSINGATGSPNTPDLSALANNGWFASPAVLGLHTSTQDELIDFDQLWGWQSLSPQPGVNDTASGGVGGSQHSLADDPSWYAAGGMSGTLGNPVFKHKEGQGQPAHHLFGIMEDFQGIT